MARRGQDEYVIGATRRNPGRRNNAPISGGPRRRSRFVPEVLITFAAIGWVMAIVIAGASFADDSITSGEAGQMLARVFAGALGIAALFVFLLAVAILGEERGRQEHYMLPVTLGVLIGVPEALLFLAPAGRYLPIPFVLLLLLLRPVRRLLTGILPGGGR